jgi:hypothetical protein
MHRHFIPCVYHLNNLRIQYHVLEIKLNTELGLFHDIRTQAHVQDTPLSGGSIITLCTLYAYICIHSGTHIHTVDDAFVCPPGASTSQLLESAKKDALRYWP